MSKNTTERVPQQMATQYAAITELTDAFCTAHLNEEYARLCRQLTATLSRKRPSPLVSGRANTWAAAIVYTIGQVNFVFDKTQTPHTTADELSAAFGVAKSTASNKAKQIRDLLKIGVLDPDWTLPSRMDQNPLAWMITVNGLIVDARALPREIQEIAYHKGLIPYIPADSEAE